MQAHGNIDTPRRPPRKNYQTQWAGQFGVAHELTRRGYLVSFTTGNAPAADLLCESPSGYAFSVQVKALSSKTYFLYQSSLLAPYPNRFFVFVLVQAPLSRTAEYFVLNSEQFRRLAEEQEQILRGLELTRGRPYAKFAPGINYSTIARHDFRDAWQNLPQ
jgi:hypothetical protein